MYGCPALESAGLFCGRKSALLIGVTSVSQMPRLVKIMEGGYSLFAHVAFQNRGVGLAKIYDNQAIDHVRESAVEIERYQLAAQLGVLPNKDWNPFAVFFEVGDGLAELVEVAPDVAQSGVIPAAKERGTERGARPDQVGELSAIVALLEILNDHFTRQAVVVIADADGSEKDRSLRPRGDEARDSLP